ncbi:MAG: M3 family metallopeptidase [Bacteroidetes bacterium]|nr:M3 family metallopeptidase [Bacteroidota bacterium]MCL2303422.1 M3 family metallopeptidase [Lentimicrobiaceae bacterium]
MRSFFAFLFVAFLSLQTFSQTNPFFEEWNTPYGVPPFDKIKVEHFMPAYQAGMAEETAQIWAIIRNPETPTFENTIVAMDRSGTLLRKVVPVFSGLTSVNNNPELQALARQFSPMLSKHYDDISLNPELFRRVKIVYEQKDQLNLNVEQKRLLENTYRNFVRSGADLPPQEQARMREINSELSDLQLKFRQNLLAETAAFTLKVNDKSRLSGLSDAQMAEAKSRAQKVDDADAFHFGLDNPSIMPFLQNADDRELRTEILTAYLNRANNNNDKDNKEIIERIVTLRLERAKLMGYENFAELAIEDRMSKNPETVMAFLDKIWAPSLKMAKNERNDIEKIMKKEKVTLPSTPADWRYFFNKSKQQKYNIDQEVIRQYFKMENVRDGIFYVCNRLWGITFEELHDIPVPHPEATAWRCNDKDGSILGIVYLDMHPRPGMKNGGAWCGHYRSHTYDENGNRIFPIITIACNFTRPSGDQPALLTTSEANTFFHEFGHALDGLFRETKYYGTSRNQRDFGEFAAQIMEHWAFEPEVLKVYAKHYKTGAAIPSSLVKKIEQNEMYGQGFITTEFLASAYLDMEYHLLTEIPQNFDAEEFEKTTLEKYGLIPQIPARHRSTYFAHTFSGGYTAGYYMYLWAEQLDSDAFEAFLERRNIFDPDLAHKLRFEIFARGGTEDAMVLYKNFRGKEPDVNALLRNRGLN